MYGGANAADALGEQPSIARIAALEDDLDAAPHLPGGPGIRHFAVFHLAIDAQMALNAGDGIDGDTSHDGLPDASAMLPGSTGKVLTKMR